VTLPNFPLASASPDDALALTARALHGWRKVVSEPDRFYAALLAELKLDEAAWAALVGHVRRYRDKFLAHLDSDLVMHIPQLDEALSAASFYYHWILDQELHPMHRGKIPPSLLAVYDERLGEGAATYGRVRAADRAPDIDEAGT
jgi:hypothetical protein